MASTVQRPTIPQFYANRSVLITGATGFVGKVPASRRHGRALNLRSRRANVTPMARPSAARPTP